MMRRLAIGTALTVGALVARALTPKLHARLLAACERMFEQAPEHFPPKRMLRGIEEIRADTARTLALLEEREQVGGAGARGEVSSTRAVTHAALSKRKGGHARDEWVAVVSEPR